MSNLKIKTECGIQKYNELKKKSKLFWKTKIIMVQIFCCYQRF